MGRGLLAPCGGLSGRGLVIGSRAGTGDRFMLASRVWRRGRNRTFERCHGERGRLPFVKSARPWWAHGDADRLLLRLDPATNEVVPEYGPQAGTGGGRSRARRSLDLGLQRKEGLAPSARSLIEKWRAGLEPRPLQKPGTLRVTTPDR